MQGRVVSGKKERSSVCPLHPALGASQHSHTPHKRSSVRLPTTLLLVPAALQPAEGSYLPYLGPRIGTPKCGSDCSCILRVDLRSCILPLSLSLLSSGHRSQPDWFSSLPFLSSYMWIFLIALFLQESLCQFPISYQWSFFHIWVYFWCVFGRKWVPHLPTLPSWLISYKERWVLLGMGRYYKKARIPGYEAYWSLATQSV